MKKQHIVLLAGVVLVLAFIGAGYVYKGKQADKIAKLAKSEDSPLNRAYAQNTGADDAKVVIVEFFDPGCETCRVFAPHVKKILAAYPKRLKLVLRYAPFHQGADTMVKILEAARLQDKYWETLQLMYDTQPMWASHHHPQPDKIWGVLPSAGVNVEEIRRFMNTPEILKIIEQDMADAKTLGVRKTPSFFVNGRPLTSFGLSQLKALVDSEIASKYPAK